MNADQAGLVGRTTVTRRHRRAHYLAAVVLGAAIAGCSGDTNSGHANSSPRTSDVATSGTTVDASVTSAVHEEASSSLTPPVTEPPVTPQDFSTISATVTKPDGSTCELCLWLAADPPQRSLGLMRVTSLAGYDGMVFRFPDDTRGGFWMKNTLMPLSIAWFSADGQFVDDADMEPCPPGTECPTYKPSDSYREAIEVEQGRLAEFGLVDGASIVFGAPCERSL